MPPDDALKWRSAIDLQSAVVTACRVVGVPSDRRPYTRDFDRLRDHVRAIGHHIEHRKLWELLRDLRMRKKLPRVGRGPNNRLPLPPVDDVLRCDEAINVSWDRLPYTPEMDRLVRMVRSATGKPYSHWTVWWALLNPRKNSRIKRTRTA